MSKPFLCKEMTSDSISIHTTASDGSILLDPADAGSNVVQIRTNLFNKNIVLSNDPTAELKLAGGNIFETASNGNVSVVTNQCSELAATVAQSMLTVTRSGTLDPADALYNQFDNTSLGGLQELSRVNINPAALGTTINSIVLQPGNPNPDGREIWIQNIAPPLGASLSLVNESGAGTAGGLIRAPLPIYVIPPGGGVSIMFDSTVTADGEWLIRGI